MQNEGMCTSTVAKSGENQAREIAKSNKKCHESQQKLENLFGEAAQGLKYFFIDSLYSRHNPEEVKMFEKETERLKSFSTESNSTF